MTTGHQCFMPPGVGCPVCTCPDCGVVGQPFVCGSPDDSSGGEDCRTRVRKLVAASAAVVAANRALERCDCDDCGYRAAAARVAYDRLRGVRV